jgi:uncharacterized damage-inducible protein DinB/predicted enzyme related to lactoylglutathione lyase
VQSQHEGITLPSYRVQPSRKGLATQDAVWQGCDMPSAVRTVTVDSHDPYALGVFWAEVLGGRLADDDVPGDPEVLVTHSGTPLLFVEVPEDKVVKNRLHLCLQPETGRDAEVQRLLGLGATVVDDRIQPDGTGWVVMADLEGNEFCVLRSTAERGEPAPGDSGDREFPPLGTADERTLLTAMLEWYRQGVLLKVAGMHQTDAVARRLGSATTAAGLVKHLAVVEDLWLTQRFAQEPMPEPWASAPWDDDPDWEFHSARSEPLEDSVALYRAACERSRAAVAAADSLDSTVRVNPEWEVSLRFILLHMVEETARHLGHLDVLRELADGTTGE